MYGCDLTCYDNDGGDCEGNGGNGGGAGNCNDGIVVVTYNVYRDGEAVASGLDENNYTDTGLTNFQTYDFAVTAVYPDGEESVLSNSISATPFPDTVHEEGYDDGSFESEFNVGGSNFSAVRFSANTSGEDLIRFKWFQFGFGGSFFIKVFEDDAGMPGVETSSFLQP